MFHSTPPEIHALRSAEVRRLDDRVDVQQLAVGPSIDERDQAPAEVEGHRRPKRAVLEHGDAVRSGRELAVVVVLREVREQRRRGAGPSACGQIGGHVAGDVGDALERPEHRQWIDRPERRGRQVDRGDVERGHGLGPVGSGLLQRALGDRTSQLALEDDVHHEHRQHRDDDRGEQRAEVDRVPGARREPADIPWAST